MAETTVDSLTGGNGKQRSKRRSLLQLAWLRFRANRVAMAGLIILILIVLLVVFAPVLSTHNPDKIDYEAVRQAPSGQHWFGTDNIGRDLYSRVLWGGRESLRVGIFATLISIFGGSILGVFSGYVGGWVDNLLQRIIEIIMAFPTILLLLSIVAALGPNLTTILVAIGISGIPAFSRLMRGSVLSALNQDYVLSARVVGARDGRIMFTHILPNIVSPVIIYGTLMLGGGVTLTAGLSYLGLGAQPPSAEWGAMLNLARTHMRSAPWMSIFPGTAVFLTVMAINMIGDGLRDALDPKMI